MKLRLLFFVLLFIPVLSPAQLKTCTIEGYAPGREGKVIAVYGYSDYITMNETKLADGVVNDTGFFSLSFDLERITYVFVKCNNVHAFVFGEPGRTVHVIMPDRDPKAQVNPNVDYEVPMGIASHDSTDMNFLAEDYNAKADSFLRRNLPNFAIKDSLWLIDKFRVSMEKYYAWVKNPYFMPWMDYGLASMEDATFQDQVYTAKKFLVGKPVHADNAEYMNFFNSFFQDYLYKWSIRREGMKINPAITNLMSYDSLLAAMKKLPYLGNDTLCELVMLKGLFDLYQNPAYNPRSILSIVQQVSSRSKIPDDRLIARNIISYYTRLKKGTAAPHFTAVDRKGNDADPLDVYKGKYIYLFFFSTTNPNAMAEFRYMAELQKRYGRKIVFVSVSVDDDTNNLKKFLKANPKYNWPIYHYGYLEKTKEDYNVYDVPAGYIIDPDGKLYLSPADNPTGDLEYAFWRIANPKAPGFVPIYQR